MSAEENKVTPSLSHEVVELPSDLPWEFLAPWVGIMSSSPAVTSQLSDHEREVLALLKDKYDPKPVVRVKPIPEPVDEVEQRAQAARALAYERYLRGKPKLTDVQKGLRKKKSDVKSKRRKAILRKHK